MFSRGDRPTEQILSRLDALEATYGSVSDADPEKTRERLRQRHHRTSGRIQGETPRESAQADEPKSGQVAEPPRPAPAVRARLLTALVLSAAVAIGWAIAVTTIQLLRSDTRSIWEGPVRLAVLLMALALLVGFSRVRSIRRLMSARLAQVTRTGHASSSGDDAPE